MFRSWFQKNPFPRTSRRRLRIFRGRSWRPLKPPSLRLDILKFEEFHVHDNTCLQWRRTGYWQQPREVLDTLPEALHNYILTLESFCLKTFLQQISHKFGHRKPLWLCSLLDFLAKQRRYRCVQTRTKPFDFHNRHLSHEFVSNMTVQNDTPKDKSISIILTTIS